MTRMLPGCTIGIFGGGQLARMIALEARRMGYRIAVLDPDPQGSAAQVADLCVTGSLQDPSAAEALGAGIAEALGHIGMLAVEMFETADGRLLVNEIAPRTHNSGHFTFGACATSQFEQHVRAICGLPLGDTTLLRPAAMLNLLGDLWVGGSPDFCAALAHPWARLHLYGKRNPLPKRKMGHVLVTGDDPDRVAAIAEGIFRQLANGVEGGQHDL